MRSICIAIIIITSISSLFAVVPPFDATTVQWAVYVPYDAADNSGFTSGGDINLKLNGDASSGWYTYLVFKSGALITSNDEFDNGAGIPTLSEIDLNNGAALSYTFIKMVYIEPGVTPSINITAPLDSQSSIVDVGAGTWKAGSPVYEIDRRINEGQIEIDCSADMSPYWIAANEMTMKSWTDVTGTAYKTALTNLLSDVSNNYIKTYPLLDVNDYIDDLDPITCVNLSDVESFCSALQGKIVTSGKTARLPNEFEWEYATRAGTSAPMYLPISKISKDYQLTDSPTDTDSSIEAEFDKDYVSPLDITLTVKAGSALSSDTDAIKANAGEISGPTITGVDGAGDPIYETRIVDLNYEVTVTVNATSDYYLSGNVGTNYDKRYAKQFMLIKRMRKDNSSINAYGLNYDGFFSANTAGTVFNNTTPNEFFDNEDKLLISLQNLYIPVAKDGIYAAQVSGGVYLYDESLVHHFEKVRGSIWPYRQRSAMGGMDAYNTALEYYKRLEYNDNATFFGTPTNGVNLQKQLENDIKKHKFANSASGNLTATFTYGNTYSFAFPANSSVHDDIEQAFTIQRRRIKDINENAPTTHNYKYVAEGNINYEITAIVINEGAHHKTDTIFSLQNGWGINNTYGNVAEICYPKNATNSTDLWNGTSDYNDLSAYGSGATHKYLALRGGSWRSGAAEVRSASRLKLLPSVRSPQVGFRIVISQ